MATHKKDSVNLKERTGAGQVGSRLAPQRKAALTQAARAKENPPVPWEFVAILKGTAYDTLVDWLNANGVPEEVIGLIENMHLLDSYVDTVRRGEFGRDSWGMEKIVLKTTHQIVALGGVFHMDGSISIARKPLPLGKKTGKA